jgi:hypothetical protein
MTPALADPGQAARAQHMLLTVIAVIAVVMLPVSIAASKAASRKIGQDAPPWDVVYVALGAPAVVIAVLLWG